MRHQKALVMILLLLGGAMFCSAAHTTARLLLSAQAARPGESIIAGVELKMDPGWHTYWRNSGASGMPTDITWDLPPGITAGTIQWPLCEKLPEGDLTTYIYSGTVVLLVPLQIDGKLRPGPVTLKAKVSWLECEKLCLPGDADVEAKLEIASTARPSANAELIKEWMEKVPTQNPSAGASAGWDAPAKDKKRPVFVEWRKQIGEKPEQVDFFPYSGVGFEVLPDTEVVEASKERVRIRKEIKKLSGDWPNTIEGVVVERGEGKTVAFEVSLPLGAGLKGQPLLIMLLYAFLGGLILNIMPCVLPVISLKVLGFVNSAREAPGRVRKLGLIYAVGVICSFLVLAALVIGLKAAGKSAGWGMQFGNPQFIIALGILITLVALNLFGVFEVNPGGRVLDAAGDLASRQGAAGAFFNGVLATILATPCTAPFLGAALGFAFLQPAPYVVLIFVTVALGLAAPYVVLSWNPALLRFLPKPGPWMERFKVAMGFPMLATALWLASLLPLHYGARAWWFGMFLAIVALAAWIYGEFIQRGRKARGAAAVMIVIVLAAGYWLVLEKQLRWRTPQGGGPTAELNSGGIQWQKWTQEALAEARARNRPVLVDFTADWCLTCQANKKFAIEVPQVETKLREVGATALLGDYTRLPADITAELNRYGRAGVPLVLVYPADSSRPPIVLPEALTPGIVLDALNKAAGE